MKVVSRDACQKYFDLMNKEVAVMHVIGEHPHLLTLREVFYSKHHIYIITGELLLNNIFFSEALCCKKISNSSSSPDFTLTP